MSLKKTTALVMCLCKLHNFCIDVADTNIPENCDTDKLEISVNGGILLQDVTGIGADENEEVRPVALLDRGHHFDDISRYVQRVEINNTRDYLLQSVIDQELQRP